MIKTEAVNLETTLETPLEMPEIEPEPEPMPEIEQESEKEQLEPPTPAPKKKGRPVGARSKVQGKPRAPRKKVTIESEPVTTSLQGTSERETRTLRPEERTNTIRIEDDSLPRHLENSRPIPQFSYDEQSALMLKLLSQQAAERRQKRVNQWKSWYT